MLFLQLLFNSIAAGSVYALMAAGFAIIYSTTRIFHIAHGVIFIMGGYFVYVLHSILKLSLVPTFIALIVFGCLIGICLELCAYLWLQRKNSKLSTLMICSLGMYIFLENILALIFGHDIKLVTEGASQSFDVGGVNITVFHIETILVCFFTFLLLHSFLSRTKTGKEIRALSNNPMLARIIGLDIEKLYFLVMMIGSVLACLSGGLLALNVGVRPEIGFSVVIIAVVAVFIGSIGYLPGAVVGAFLLGFAQNFGIWKIPSAWEDTIVYVVLLIFLLFMPEGIFRNRILTRGV